MDSFVYNRLQTRRPQIRLVLLLPGLDHEKLSCGLITVFLDDAPQYEALSYTWGDPNVKVPILLHGQDFLVGTNLKAALCHLRLVTRVRKLWIDAVCINQADIYVNAITKCKSCAIFTPTLIRFLFGWANRRKTVE
jgi:hypothetical protein